MFQTFSHARIPGLPAFGDEPMLWAAVEHDIHRPWFYVRLIELGDDIQWCRMILLGDELSLQSLMRAQRSGWLVESVLLATPSHVNGSDRWLLEPLERLQLFGRQGDQTAVVYTVAGGHSYMTGAETLELDGLVPEEIFAQSMCSHSVKEPFH